MSHTYLIALGSNMRVPGIGPPRAVLEAALLAIEERGACIKASAPFVETPPIGPSQRRYANGAAIIETALAPPAMLAFCKQIERDFGRGRSQLRGQRWRSRSLDLDIVLWSGGRWQAPDLIIPHSLFRSRDFVLGPARRIAGGWRDPVSGMNVRQLAARLRSRVGRA